MPKFTSDLRKIADALEDGRLRGDALLIVQLEDGTLLSEDSGLNVVQATTMAVDWAEDLAEAARQLARCSGRQGRRRCNGGAR